MTLALIILSIAERDLLEAQTWYDIQRPGLGAEFRAAINTTFQQMAEQPLQYPLVHRQLRRAVLRRFPYLIYFRADSDRIVIMACLHSKRHPRIAQTRNR